MNVTLFFVGLTIFLIVLISIWPVDMKEKKKVAIGSALVAWVFSLLSP